MKTKLIIIVLFFNGISYAQHWTRPYDITITYSLPKLQVIDSIFLSDIDSLILTSECSVLKKGNYKYFGIGTYPIKSDTILFELIELPVSDSTAVGYFEYRNYIFFVQNSFDKTLFKKTKQRKKFTYKRGKLAVVEDFPLWVCLYNKRRLILLEEYTW